MELSVSSPSTNPRMRVETAELPEATRAGDAPERERGVDSKTRQILDGARAVFLRDGFDGASMNDIAREAGVSKGTLYVYFSSKDALFAAYVRDDRRRQAEQIVPYSSGASLREALIAIGTELMRELLAPSHVAHVRTAVAAAAKFPEIGNAFYEAGPEYGQRRFAAFLAGRRDIAGDCDQAAVDFVNLVQGTLLRRALFRSEQGVVDEIDETVRRGVESFLRLYAVTDRPQ